MGVGRRTFCLAGAVGLSSQVTVGTVSAQSRITVEGTIQSEVDTDLTGVEFRLSHTSTDQFSSDIIPSSGEINLTVAETGQYRATIFDKSAKLNKIPVVYSFNNIAIGENGDIGEFVIPEAYQTDIRFVDASGDPIEGLPVNFRAQNGTGFPPGSFTTNSDGYVKHAGADEPGVELTSPTQVEIQPESTSTRQAIEIQTVFVTESTEYEFELSDAQNANLAADSNSIVPGDADRQRGLFSNNPSERTGTLSNPTSLTTLGFLLSVGGIAYQLIGGR